jgi:hypothetical protein
MSAIAAYLLRHWKILAAAALLHAVSFAAGHVSRLKAENARLESEVASYRALVASLSSSLAWQYRALKDRENAVSALESSYSAARGKASLALARGDWGDAVVPAGVADVLRGKD